MSEQAFLRAYSAYVSHVLRPTQDEAKSLFARWRDPLFWSSYATKSRSPAPSPIQRTRTRIKRPESVVDKILRKPASYPSGLHPDSFRAMTDALGARIVIYFPAHYRLIDREIRNGGSCEVSETTAPVAYLGEGIGDWSELPDVPKVTKPSEYASVHYIIRLRESCVPREDQPWFELQVRTMVEDVWAEIEHVLGYKPEKRTSLPVRRQFRNFSMLLRSVDEHFNLLHEEQSRFQEEVTYKDDDPLNPENLPPVLAELGVGCSQRELDGMLKLLVSRNVSRIGQLRRLASLRRMDLIKNTFRSEEAREPSSSSPASRPSRTRPTTRRLSRGSRGRSGSSRPGTR